MSAALFPFRGERWGGVDWTAGSWFGPNCSPQFPHTLAPEVFAELHAGHELILVAYRSASPRIEAELAHLAGRWALEGGTCTSQPTSMSGSAICVGGPAGFVPDGSFNTWGYETILRACLMNGNRRGGPCERDPDLWRSCSQLRRCCYGQRSF